MEKLRKLLVFLTKKKQSPDYTKRQWIFKSIQLIVCAFGMDLAGIKLKSLEDTATLTQTPLANSYVYFAGVQGLLMGLAFWKMLEMYWWAKDRVSVTVDLSNVTKPLGSMTEKPCKVVKN